VLFDGAMIRRRCAKGKSDGTSGTGGTSRTGGTGGTRSWMVAHTKDGGFGIIGGVLGREWKLEPEGLDL